MASASEASVGKRLGMLYNIMQSVEGKLGGGEGVEGIYGSITQTGMQKIYSSLRHNCGFDKQSTLVDIGAGLGRPLLHGLIEPGIKGAFGIELDQVKVSKAEAFLRQSLQQLAARTYSMASQAADGHEPPEAPHISEPLITCASIEDVPTLNPATHAYSFWEGVPHSGKAAFGRLFAASTTLKAVAVVQRSMRGEDPAGMMADLGFGPLLLIANFPVKMSGSGRSFQAYVFSKIQPGSMAFLRSPAPLAAAAAAQPEAALSTELQPTLLPEPCTACKTGVKRQRPSEEEEVMCPAHTAAPAATPAPQPQQPPLKQRSILKYGRTHKFAPGDLALASKAAAGQHGKGDTALAGQIISKVVGSGVKDVMVAGGGARMSSRLAAKAAARAVLSQEAAC